MDVFNNDEAGYLAWHKEHPNSFVLNRFGGTNPAFNVLHRSNCVFLWREKDEGKRTVVEKWCSATENELAQQADSNLGPQMWKRCGICFRTATRNNTDLIPSAVSETTTLDSIEQLWISGEPAVWLGSGEKEWKTRVRSILEKDIPEVPPQWMDFELRLPQEKLYRKDLDNLLTPLLESARDAGWTERGFKQLGSVTAYKVAVTDISKAGALVKWHPEPPHCNHQRAGILIEVPLTKLDADTVKWALYDKSYELFQLRPEVRFPPLCPMSIDILVTIDNAQQRKSIQALMKPCIDGLEPILGHPDNLLPEPREVISRRLAPQDEMVMSLNFHVWGGDSNRVAVLISRLEDTIEYD